MMGRLEQVLGILLVLIILLDIFLTVLYARWTCPALVERHWLIWRHVFRTEPGL